MITKHMEYISIIMPPTIRLAIVKSIITEGSESVYKQIQTIQSLTICKHSIMDTEYYWILQTTTLSTTHRHITITVVGYISTILQTTPSTIHRYIITRIEFLWSTEIRTTIRSIMYKPTIMLIVE